MVSFGVFQLAASRGRLKGLSLFRKRLTGYVFCAVMVGVACWWFFRIDRNIPDTEGAPAGGQLFALMLLALIATTVLTIIASSIIKARWGSREPYDASQRGLEALKKRTYLQQITRSLRKR